MKRKSTNTDKQIELDLAQDSKIAITEIGIGHAFVNGDATYVRIIPVKTLLRSTTLYEIATRSDVFALNIATGAFTVFPSRLHVTPVGITFRVKRDQQ